MTRKLLVRAIVVGATFAAALAASGATVADEAKPAAQAPAMSLTDFVHKADRAHHGQTTAAVIKMDIHTSSFDRSYSLVYWAEEGGGKERNLIKVLGPALWRGHGTLKVGDRLTLFNPNSDRLTVLSSSMLGDSWMGSHFTNDDLVKQTHLARDYTSKELKAWNAALPDGRQGAFRRVELRPTPTAPVLWERIVLEAYQDGASVVPVRLEYFRRATDTAPNRTLTYSDVKQLGGRLVPSTLTMIPADKPSEYTKLIYQEIKFNTAIPAGKFTEQALKQ